MKKICIFLSLLVIFINFSSVYGIQQDQISELTFKLSLNPNNPFMSADNSEKVILGTTSLNTAELNICLDNNINNRTKVSGLLKLNDSDFQIVAEGYLNQFDVFKENDFAKGIFTGYILKNNKIIDEVVFDLSFDTKEMKCLASSMTIGVIKEDMEAKPISLLFGNINEDLNKSFYEKHVLGKSNEESVVLSKNLSIKSIEPDYTLRTYDDFNSSYGDIMYVAGYHPSKIGDHENASMFVKMWTNKENIADYFAGYYDTTIVPDSTAVYKLKFEILNEKYWEADDPTPADGDNSFDMPLPIYLGSLGYQLITVPITTNYTDFTASGSPNENKASWILEKYFGYFNSTDAQSTSPWYDDDDYGMGGKVNFSFQASTSVNIQRDITFSGTYYCSAVADEYTYVTKYLSFYHYTESSITITP